jgi:hypothetical protein
MVSQKLLQDLLFAKKVEANMVKYLGKSTPKTEINTLLTNQLERIKLNIIELQFLLDIATNVAKSNKPKTKKSKSKR